MDTWTAKLVWSELVSAAAVADNFAGLKTDVDADSTAGNCSIPDIARMQQARCWLSLLTQEDRDLVWARARKTRWKQICWTHRISRPTAHRRRQQALEAIVAHLRVHRA
jgi:hypothetical protein